MRWFFAHCSTKATALPVKACARMCVKRARARARVCVCMCVCVSVCVCVCLWMCVAIVVFAAILGPNFGRR